MKAEANFPEEDGFGYAIRTKKSKIIDIRYTLSGARDTMAKQANHSGAPLHISRVCGAEFMAGQICTLRPHHENEHR